METNHIHVIEEHDGITIEHHSWAEEDTAHHHLVAHGHLDDEHLMSLLVFTLPRDFPPATIGGFKASMRNEFEGVKHLWNTTKLAAGVWARENLKGSWKFIPASKWLRGSEGSVFICEKPSDVVHCSLRWSSVAMSFNMRDVELVPYREDWFEVACAEREK